MRQLRVPDILFIACFSHVFSWIFSLLFMIETNKHNCKGMHAFDALNIVFSSLCIIAFLVWAIKEWRREHYEDMIREPYTQTSNDEEDL